MSFSPFSKLSKISARLGFSQKKEKEEDGGLQEIVVSDQNHGTPPRDPRYSSIEEDLSTVVQRRNRYGESEDEPRVAIFPRLPSAPSSNISVITIAAEIHPIQKTESEIKNGGESESSSSPSTSIEDVVQRAILSHDLDDFADALDINKRPPKLKKKNGQPKSSKAQPKQIQQQSRQENLDEIIERPMYQGENQEEDGFVLEPLQGIQTPPTSARCRRPANHVSIDLDDVGIGEKVGVKNPTYVESYLEFMYTFGLSPYRPEGSTGGFWGYCQRACFIQIVLYWIETIAALLQTLALAKHYTILFFDDKQDLEDFTNMAFHIMNIFIKIYSAYLFTMEQHKFAKMLGSWGRLQEFAAKYSKVEQTEYKTIKVIVLAITSIIVSTLSVVFVPTVSNWTPKKAVLQYSATAATSAYIWTPDGIKNNVTGIEPLYNQYGINLTTGNLFIGLSWGAVALCNRIMVSTTSDLILTAGATLKKEIARLAKEVKNPENDIHPVTLENFERDDGPWKHYQLLTEAVDDTNDTFDCLLKYMHIDNIMLFVYLIMNAFDNELALFTLVYFIYNIIKVSCTYRIATQASEHNETFQEWIRRLVWKSTDDNFIRKAYVLRDRMKAHPLGLGKGQFMIDESFLFRFLGAVGSVFVLQAQSREASTGNEAK